MFIEKYLLPGCGALLFAVACGSSNQTPPVDGAVDGAVDAAIDGAVDASVDPCAACVGMATCEPSAAQVCSCPAGYEGDGTTEGTGCDDLDECAMDMDDCDAYARCDNLAGSFACRGLFAPSPFQNRLWRLDPVTWEPLFTDVAELGTSIVNGTNGLTSDPLTHQVYAIAKVKGAASRLLVTVDTRTMTYTTVGELGDNFAGLAFDGTGQLFGVTGDGADTPETLFTIDKTTAQPTVAVALGNGGDGEAFAYNPADDHFYHWSGNSTVVFEKFPAVAPYTPVTSIPITGTTGGETFGAHFDPGAGDFVVFNIDSQVVRASTTGSYTGPFGPVLPDDLRSPAYGLTSPQRVVPDTGAVAGGDTVVLHSQGFSILTAPPTVTFDGVVSPMVTIDSDTQLTVTVPAGAAPGPVLVRATSGDDQEIWQWPAGFTYVAQAASAAHD